MTAWVRRVSPLAVVCGTIVDLVATNLAMVPVAVFVFAEAAEAGMTSGQQNEAFKNAFTHNSSIYAIGLVLGCAASVLGGWTAAKVARRSELLNGALSAVGCVGLGVYGWFATSSPTPVWQHVSFLVLSPALGSLGGIIRVRQLQRAQAASSASDLEHGTIVRGRLRAIYLANRVITAVLGVAVFFFASMGVYGYNRHDSAIIFGSVFICSFGVTAVFLFLLAARRLRSGRAYLALHLSAFGIAATPFLLMIVGLVLQHAG